MTQNEQIAAWLRGENIRILIVANNDGGGFQWWIRRAGNMDNIASSDRFHPSLESAFLEANRKIAELNETSGEEWRRRIEAQQQPPTVAPANSTGRFSAGGVAGGFAVNRYYEDLERWRARNALTIEIADEALPTERIMSGPLDVGINWHTALDQRMGREAQ